MTSCRDYVQYSHSIGLMIYSSTNSVSETAIPHYNNVTITKSNRLHCACDYRHVRECVEGIYTARVCINNIAVYIPSTHSLTRYISLSER